MPVDVKKSAGEVDRDNTPDDNAYIISGWA